MSVDHCKLVDVFTGKRVKLTLKTASYRGVVQRIHPDKTLTLTDVVYVKDGRLLPGVKLFFGHEIVKVWTCCDGLESFQQGRLGWLQIATKNKVYLFDILLLGAQAFKSGLTVILQSTSILKVVHDCRGLASSLLSQFGVNLKNVFDTQVADVFCFSSDTGGLLPDRISTLQEVVSQYLKVPSSTLSSLQMTTQLTMEKVMQRPCPLAQQKVMALRVIHLQPLRLVLLDALMKEYLGLVDSYLSSGHNGPGDVEHVTMSRVLELPKELRELEHIRQARQRRAVLDYNVTELGFLERYKPLSQTLPKATPSSTTLPSTTPLSQTLPKATLPLRPCPQPHLCLRPCPKPRLPLRPCPQPHLCLRRSPKPPQSHAFLYDPALNHTSVSDPAQSHASMYDPAHNHASVSDPAQSHASSATLPSTTPLSQTLPKLTPSSMTLPSTTPLSQTPPKATPSIYDPAHQPRLCLRPRPKPRLHLLPLPITTPLSQTPPKAHAFLYDPALNHASVSDPAQSHASSTTLPSTTPLSQTPPKATPPSMPRL
ncbi:hypothetical protein NHX12_019416 [Muraenolepis orangiensis]|uniref:3'-5' exonuclease domain-containing protein n=1 Tax=Muraenolepis orangiensis TaxID=630683 RepID=A0A9Q0IW17_9TELE|nr:hypothetical protein NHX12_019416 [Muraenolepis orangiensis]